MELRFPGYTRKGYCLSRKINHLRRDGGELYAKVWRTWKSPGGNFPNLTVSPVPAQKELEKPAHGEEDRKRGF